MKRNVKTAIAIVALSIGFVANAQDKSITTAQLPAGAQEFIKKNFSQETISKAWEDKEMFDTDYTVSLSNGIEIEFDGKGNWEEIDGHGKALPNTVVPQAISTYVSKSYNGQNVVQIDKNSRGYEVELSNGTDLDFDPTGKFLRVDD